MASDSRRFIRSLPVIALLAAGLLSWWSATAGAEERKFVVMIADLPKDHPGTGLDLPRKADIRDAYFDKTKNSLTDGPGRVDSFSEWWEECSYGDVTVSGDVFGWVSLPWPSRPVDFDGDTSFGSASIIPHVEMNTTGMYEPADGEFFDNSRTKFDYDFDGVGFAFLAGPLSNKKPGDLAQPATKTGLGDTDAAGRDVWAPGERFIDLNDNGTYDAGVREWGIDKDGNGRIDRSKKAISYDWLFKATITYPEEGGEPVFINWVNDLEWYDANGDTKWANDGAEQLVLTTTFVGSWAPAGTGALGLYKGDWGGTEIWIDRDFDYTVGDSDRATPVETEGPWASFETFIIKVNDPQDESVEYFDEQWNGVYDFPEPFEDFLRRWHPLLHSFVRIDDDQDPLIVPPGVNKFQYIRDNYPGQPSLPGQPKLIEARIGNKRYDAPDLWWGRNVGSAYSDGVSNKMQEVIYEPQDAGENAEWNWRSTGAVATPEPSWLGQFWGLWYGTTTPLWVPYPAPHDPAPEATERIPYTRRFDPAQPVPPLANDPADTKYDYPFEPDAGGPLLALGEGMGGVGLEGAPYESSESEPLKPGIDDGMFDAMAEFEDLPSSIYHIAGDQDFGEVTSPVNDSQWGKDEATPATDGIVQPAGPLAYNVHGDGGFDAGNVLNLEYITWRNDGQSSTDWVYDFDGDSQIDFVWYHRDTNLDGMIDLGETPGDTLDYGVPEKIYSNYGVDPYPGTPPNGGPWSLIMYPFNRWRLLEDCVAALDHSVDWDDFLGGPPPFGDVISGVILLPATTAQGMFMLPAAGVTGYWPVQTRDQPSWIWFFDGLGTALDERGEGNAWEPGSFQVPFSVHEYCHLWEGYPDLYDYDVYREDFPGVIINNPIAAWCIMAGGFVHPVPILKVDSGWIDPVDITTALTPAGITELDIRAWEYDRNQTVFVYTNPLQTTEEFWFWRSAPGTYEGGRLVRKSFDRFHPGPGLLIMHVDREANPEGLPPQQRLESHFTYQIVQADGLQDLEAGKSFGDAGDPWPGSTNAKAWNRNSDPDNRWYSNDQGSGLDIIDVQQLPNSTKVKFRWTPQELPSLTWVQPPGGISVNHVYTLKYFAYDQYGGTTIRFYAVPTSADTEPSYHDGMLLGSRGKTPGEVDGVFQANVGNLADGTYKFYAKLTPGVGADNRLENSWSAPRGRLTNVGDGTLTVNGVDLVVLKFERWTVRCIDASAPGTEIWEVIGSRSGAQVGLAVTGLQYSADPVEDAGGAEHDPLRFTIASGTLPFAANDEFNFLTTGLTEFSSAVLIDDGNVVVPEPPVANARIAAGPASGLAPLRVDFAHDQSYDPHDAALTFTWNFGDGTAPVTTANRTLVVTHTFTAPSPTPYTVTLTVTNAFGLSDTDTLQIKVAEAAPPTVRMSADPTSGRAPLDVRFTGDTTTDPNPGTTGLDFVWNFGDGAPVATQPNVVHTYVKPGTYRATLTVTNRPYGKRASMIAEIRVFGPPPDRPPLAALDVDRTFGPSPLTVTLDARRSSDPEGGVLRYNWDFGDGSTPLTDGPAIVTHTFAGVRSFNVTLTAIDVNGQSDTATIVVVVTGSSTDGNQSPVARIQTSATQGAAPFAVTFDGRDSSDPEGDALDYEWSFGDGSPAAFEALVTHTFSTARQYTVVLKVRDPSSALGAASVTVSVTSPAGDDGSGAEPPADTGTPGNEVVPMFFGCGQFGLVPLALTLLGMGGLRRLGGRRIR